MYNEILNSIINIKKIYNERLNSMTTTKTYIMNH